MKKFYLLLLLLSCTFLSKAQFPAPYCAEVFSNAVEPITNVTFAGINNSSPAAIDGTPDHQDFTSITGSVLQGGAYLIEVQGNTDGNFATYVTLFADWNQDGDFIDPGESYNIGSIVNSTGSDGKKASATITVPGDATLGSTRIRVSKKYSGTGTYPTVCSASGYGQAEDYTLTVALGTNCTGTPVGGGVSPASSLVCNTSTAVTLTSTAANSGTGITYQWQSSPAGANTFTNISGATSNTYAATATVSTDYRVIITCTSSGLSGTSTNATITVSGPPANDLVCNAIPLTLDGPADCQNTTCATATGDPGFSASTPNNTVWYTYTPSVSGPARVRFTRPAGVTTGLLNGWLGVYTATGSCPSLSLTQEAGVSGFNLITTDPVSVNTPSLTAGTTYYFMIDGNSGAFGAFCIQVITPPTPPPCTNTITPANGATNVAVPTTFDWTPIPGITSYQILLSSDNGATYPLSGVFGAPPATNIGGLAYNTTYRWYVRGISGPDSSSTACAVTTSTTFTTQAAPPPPVNDNCITATPITSSSGIVAGTTISATQSLAPMGCAGFTSSKSYDVWYTATALRNGSFSVNVTGNGTFDPVVHIYTGSCATPDSVTCADATFGGGIEVATVAGAIAGTQYLIRVSDYYSTTDSAGTFTISVNGSALPVTGMQLIATRNGNKTLLSWQTYTEINNDGFELQRSIDGISFATIASVSSKAAGGNSIATLNYSVQDENPFKGVNYYRIKQNDKNGRSAFSNIVLVKSLPVTRLTLTTIHPNPVANVLKTSVQMPAAERVTLIITDITGRILHSQASNLVAGDNAVNIDVARLTSGTYMLKVVCTDGCEKAVQKFIKL